MYIIHVSVYNYNNRDSYNFLNIGLKYTDILNSLFDSNLDVTHLNSFL